MSVTQSDINTINNLINNNDKWSLTNNCSSFAVKIWNAVSFVNLSAGVPNIPTALMNSIKSKSGYSTGKSIMEVTPIGYVSNGSFVTVSSSNVRSVDKEIMSTQIGKAYIIEEINMNPNSME